MSTGPIGFNWPANQPDSVIGWGGAAGTYLRNYTNADVATSLVFDTIADFVAATSTTYSASDAYVRSYYDPSDYADGGTKGGGWFWYDASDTTTADDGCTVIVDASSRRWKRHGGKTIDLYQCGAYGDSSTDDLAAINRAFALINATTIDTLTVSAGNYRLSDNPIPITASTWSILGAGFGVSTFAFTTGDNACAFEIGSTLTTAQRWTIDGIRISNTTNKASLTGADYTFWVRNSAQGRISNCAQVDGSGFVRFGDEATSQAQYTWVTDCHLAPDLLGSSALFFFEAATTAFIDSVYAGSGICSSNARVIKIVPFTNNNGVDAINVSNCTLNFVASDLDYAVEIATAGQGCSNIHITGSCIDGGSIAHTFINIDAASDAQNTKALRTLKYTGCRMAANTDSAGPTGVFMKATSSVANHILGVGVSNCSISCAGALTADITGTGVEGYSDIVFTGNTIINMADSTGGTVFDVETGGLVIVGNIVTHSGEANTNRFEYFLKTRTVAPKNITCYGNVIHEVSDPIGFDLSSLSASDMDQPKISGNAGKSSPAIREVQTTDATVTSIGNATLADGFTYRVSGRVVGVQSDDSNRASYSFVGMYSATGGAATLAGSIVTTEYESDAAWDVTLDTTGALARVRVTGKAATTINWGLYDVKLEVLN